MTEEAKRLYWARLGYAGHELPQWYRVLQAAHFMHIEPWKLCSHYEPHEWVDMILLFKEVEEKVQKHLQEERLARDTNVNTFNSEEFNTLIDQIVEQSARALRFGA